MDMLERPCIHVGLFGGADPGMYRWVEIGAEEEGVPTRLITGEAEDLISLAYHAAQSSRLNIGVAVSAQAIALHEQHMPARQPVLVFQIANNAPLMCRVMGANAARMVVHRPLQVDVDPTPPPPKFRPAKPAPAPASVARPAPPAEANFDPAQLARIVAAVARKLQERGL